MTRALQTGTSGQAPEAGKSAIWIGLVIAASLLFSWALACATPFAAIAAIAALSLPARGALLLVGITFVINQAIGYFVLDYPRDWQSYGWGVAIGLAAFAALFASIAALRISENAAIRASLTFLTAFVAYELVLIASTLVLPAGGGFTLAVIGEVLWINLLAFIGFIAMRRLAEAAGLRAHPPALAALRR